MQLPSVSHNRAHEHQQAHPYQQALGRTDPLPSPGRRPTGRYPARMADGSIGIASDLAPGGALRAAINLGNPVLAQGTAAAPAGVTVDLAREIGARLGLPVELACFDAARDSFAAVTTGRTDICLLAIEPARAAEVAFTAPYVLIEGVYAVSEQSPLVTVADVDRPGVRIGVNRGAASALFPPPPLLPAAVGGGPGGTGESRPGARGAGAGTREPMTAFVRSH